MLDFSILSYVVIILTLLVVPYLIFGTYYYSGHGLKKSVSITSGVIIWGIIMLFTIFRWQFNISEPLGVPLLLVVNLLWPSLIVVFWKKYFVGNGLNLRWLTGLQIFRLIGFLFLMESARNLVGVEFANVAGIGDIVVGTVALTLFVQLVSNTNPSKSAFYLLIIFGVLDFVSAFTFGFLSSEIPFQVFAQGEIHAVNIFPLGAIPFFLVPIAMAYHWLMYFSLKTKNLINIFSIQKFFN